MFPPVVNPTVVTVELNCEVVMMFPLHSPSSNRVGVENVADCPFALLIITNKKSRTPVTLIEEYIIIDGIELWMSCFIGSFYYHDKATLDFSILALPKGGF